MSFLYPYMLWALVAVSIPVIIHLFNFRRHKKEYFTNVRHIQELKQQTRRQSRLRHLLVLIARILAVASLVLAFSQPYIPVSDAVAPQQAGNLVSIYVDNSFSMEAEATNGELLSLAMREAGEIAQAYRSSDRFQLLTNDLEGRHQRLLSQEEFLQLLEEVRPSPNSLPLSTVFGHQQEILGNAGGANRIRFALSDFQKSTADIENITPDSSITTYLVPFNPENTGNLYIDSCWFESPVHQLGQAVKLVVSIKNASEKDYEKIPVKLTVNGTQKALASFDIQAAATALVELPFTNNEAGIQFGTLEITDYPVTFDDDLYLVYEVQPAIPLLVIHGDREPVYLNSLLAGDPAFNYSAVSYKNINYDRLPSYFLIILDGVPVISSGLTQALNEFTAGGGSLLIIPSPGADLPSYSELSEALQVSRYQEAVSGETEVSSLDLEHPVFLDVFEEGRPGGKWRDAQVDLPKVKKYFPLKGLPGTFSLSLIKMLNGEDFLVSQSSGSGSVYQLCVPLDDAFSSFQRHALFVPVIYRIAFLSGATSPLYHTIGSSSSIILENTELSGDNILKIVDTEGAFEWIPGQRSQGSSMVLNVYDQVRVAGHYRVYSEDMTLAGLAFNYNRSESDLSVFTAGELDEAIGRKGLVNTSVLDEKIKPMRDTIQELNQGKKLWKLFIILALFFLASEVFLLRIWSKD